MARQKLGQQLGLAHEKAAKYMGLDRTQDILWSFYTSGLSSITLVLALTAALCGNLAYADLLWEENTVRSLKSTAEVVQQNRA